MANLNAPHGLVPLRSPGGTIQANEYRVSATNTALFLNDPVVRGADGTVDIATAGAGNYITGVIIALLDSNRVPVCTIAASSGTGCFAIVADDINQEFEAQDDGDTTQLALVDEGTNVNLILTHAGSTSTGLSGAEIDSSTTGAGATGQLRLVRLLPAVDNAIGANARWIVKINYHTMAQGTVGVQV